MNREFLEALELDKEIVNKIMAEYGKSYNPLKTENEKLKAEFESTKQELEKANEVLKGFDGVDVKVLNSQIEEYKASIKNMRADNEAKIKSMIIDNAIESKFSSVPEKYRNLLKMQVNKDKIVVDKDNNLTGLEEQFANLKEQYEDLFTAEKQPNLKFGLEQKETPNETVNKKTEDLAQIFGVKM